MIYTLSLPPDSLNFGFSIPEVSENAYFLEKNKERDTITVWLTDSSLYSQPQISTILNYPFTDTTGAVVYKEDTITMRFLSPRAPRVARVKKPVFNFVTNISGGILKPEEKIIFTSQTPFRQPDTSRIRLYELSEDKKIKIPFSLIKDDINSRKYFLNAKILQGKKYLFIADSASFGNIYDEYSDSSGIRFSVRDAESYSKLTLNISNYEGDRIIQLLNNTEKVIREGFMKKDGELIFPLLESGLYRLRVIYDLNGDGKWTTGDFSSGRQPEPVSYYPQELDIKKGWELDQAWDIGILNVKDQKLRVKKQTR